MVRLEFTSTTTPEEIIVQAQRLGQYILTTKNVNDVAVKLDSVIYILKPKILKNTGMDICVVTIVEIPQDGIFVFRNTNQINVDGVQQRQYPNMSILDYTDNEWKSVFNDLEIDDYGNVDWKGSANSDDEVPVLCWKGPSTRHFQVDDLISIPRYMVKDDITSMIIDGVTIETQHYTPFSPNVYEKGKVLYTYPNGGALIYEKGLLKTEVKNGITENVLTTKGDRNPKVLGCAYIGESLVSVVGMSYKDLTNPKGKIGGYFNEVYVGESRVGYEQHSRPIANWFFNQSGTEAQCVQDHFVHKVVITKHVAKNEDITYSATFSTKPACTGSVTESDFIDKTPIHEVGDKGMPDLWAYEIPANWGVEDKAKVGGETVTETLTVKDTRTCIEAVDYQGDTEVIATTSYNLTETSTYETERYNVVGWLEEYPYDAPATLTLTCADPGGCTHYSYGVGEIPVSASGGCSPYTFSVSSGMCTINPLNGMILTVEPCAGHSGQSGIVPFTVRDSVGNTAGPLNVALAGGTFNYRSTGFVPACDPLGGCGSSLCASSASCLPFTTDIPGGRLCGHYLCDSKVCGPSQTYICGSCYDYGIDCLEPYCP